MKNVGFVGWLVKKKRTKKIIANKIQPYTKHNPTTIHDHNGHNSYYNGPNLIKVYSSVLYFYWEY